ncbi:(2Fe-2S)-binding protein [Pseudomonas fulva]|nr:(2Fe-2S)-binding protein [Pseudomonas fulva]MBF8778626.1 (2Fe-2S)-binding protein [Pseudomonas fulva]
MPMLKRTFDIQPLRHADIVLFVDDWPVRAAQGETVLSVLNAVGWQRLSRSDQARASSAFCGMGICHCCLVTIDERPRRRACQTLVENGMRIRTGLHPRTREVRS